MGLDKNMLGGGSIYRKSSKYPQCKIFQCPKARGVLNICCAYCARREKCSSPCLNNPDECRMCVIPPDKEKEMTYALGDDSLPDAPMIREAERNGIPDEEDAICPICGSVCETIYFDKDNDVFGCDECVHRMDAHEYMRTREEDE